MSLNSYLARPRDVVSKFFKVARTDTTATIRGMIPKDSFIVGAWVVSVGAAAASDAATTATVSCGTTSSANELINALDVKTAATATGFQPAAAKGAGLATQFTADKQIYVKYAETGTASTTGGPWVIRLDYVQSSGQGDLLVP